MAILARLDAVALVTDGDPRHGVTLVGAAPDDGIFSEGSSETVSMIDVGCPLTTPLIEASEGGRLNSEGSGGHVCLFVVCILQGQRAICCAVKDSASAVTTLTGRIGSHSR